MEQLKKLFYLILGLALVIWSFYQFLQQPASLPHQQNSVLYLMDAAIPVEVADTDMERSLGLSGRESLARGSGLLFIFETPGNYGFWMKDMRFPIDIVWIDEDWKVISVEKDARPETFPRIFYPNAPIKFVLELNSGDASRLGIDAGLTLSPNH
jgi:uncharacterized protein